MIVTPTGVTGEPVGLGRPTDGPAVFSQPDLFAPPEQTADQRAAEYSAALPW